MLLAAALGAPPGLPPSPPGAPRPPGTPPIPPAVPSPPALPPPAAPPPSSPPPPLTCHPDGGSECESVYVNKDFDMCQRESQQLCDTVSKVEEKPKTGFSWGIAASLIADIIISVGLALQKLAHNRMSALNAAEGKEPAPQSRTSADDEANVYSLPGSNLEKRGSVEVVPDGPPPASVFKMPVWWLGLFMVIGGEVGSALPYMQCSGLGPFLI